MKELSKQFKENGYVICKNTIENKVLLDFLGVYAYNVARIKGCESNDKDVPNTPSFYGDFAMENLAFFIKPKLEQITGLSLLQTYTFFRVYKAGDAMFRHSDRPECEVSVSMTLRKNKDEEIWPIYIDNKEYKKKRGDESGGETPAFLDTGDALVYRGCECEHWRNEYTEGTKLAQLFMHYVDANGDKTHLKNDGRESIFSLYL